MLYTACMLFVGLLVAGGSELPTVTVTADDTQITTSCRIVIPPDLVLADPNNDGVIQVVADDITIEFAPGSVLQGAAPDTPPDQYQGTGIRIIGHKGVTLRGVRLRGYNSGLIATTTDGLVLEDIDASDGKRSRLRSTPLVEIGADWLQPHANDEHEWLRNYGAALYVEDSARITVRHCRVWHSQNGLCLDRVDDSRIYDNDFSFNSGWGLALWRCQRNVISRNALDFNIRGYSHGIYNRGQDSAGILFFEQNSGNVIAENSVTHGGDGLFGFAGHEAVGDRNHGRKGFDYTRRGCNYNLLIGNDFSYAAAHGIELTFSFGNRLLNNRMVGNAICGVWGGYSQDLLIAKNLFERNGEMGYGLERGGINIDTGRDNTIIYNTFRDNRCGVHLWRRDDPNVENWPWGKSNIPDFNAGVVAHNTFDGDVIGIQLRRPIAVTLADNQFTNVPDELVTEDDPQVTRVDDWLSTQDLEPNYPVFGDTHPVGARAALAGRAQIIMTEWGPWDHVSPLVRLIERRGATHVWEVQQLPPDAKVEVTGDVQLAALPAAADATTRCYAVTAAGPGVWPYTLHVQSGAFDFQEQRALLAAQWDVTWFPYESPSRNARAGSDNWDAAASGTDVHTLHLDDLHFFINGRALDGNLAGPEAARTLPTERFGLIARTRIPLAAGKWRFRVIADDGVRVRVDGQEIINVWRRQWMPRPHSATVAIATPHEVPIEVDYFQNAGWSALALEIMPAETLADPE